jgi:lysophospholipase L1-like esterase
MVQIMKKLILFVLGLLGLAACQPKAQSKRMDTMNYLALGDSYTIGEAVDEAGRFPAQLVAKLNAAGLAFAPPRIVARTGWTTGELLADLAQADPGGGYDLVSLLIGVNNQYRGLDFAIYEREFEQLLRLALAKAGGRPERVCVVSIPDYGVTPFAADRDPAKIAREIDAYNATNRALAQRLGVRYFDITPISRGAERDPSLLASDALHPSAKMYAAWVALMKDELIKIWRREKSL